MYVPICWAASAPGNKEAHRKTGRLLDIGTGTGYFSDTMVRRGWKVEAVEKSPQAREFAKTFRLDVKPESALKEFVPGSFDVNHHSGMWWNILNTSMKWLGNASWTVDEKEIGLWQYPTALLMMLNVTASIGRFMTFPSSLAFYRALYSNWLPVMALLWRRVIRCRLMRSTYPCWARNIAAVRA